MFRRLQRFAYSNRELKRFCALDRNEREIVFYVESEDYFRYLSPFIDELIEHYDRRLVYVTSSLSDPLLKRKDGKLPAFFIGDEIIRTIFFAGLNVRILVTTLLDLGRFLAFDAPSRCRS